MSDSQGGRDLDYYRQRERQERGHAARADDLIAKRIHLEMAERYSTLVRSSGSGSSGAAA
ncbi:hypothetical protein [Sphingomonas sp. LM7]|uniref:hypothetical protein n=1 Tax=Sphingomonas sp. LM7 TaxID=1938607 RepID=UPI000983B7F8|nr:hypothetical protein [Sphingomonas sp. LM7]AQR74764.1 hypothetical protein BXU08_14865 [Sphingomonas sp. LM7]